jgi:hypothetical protein
VTESRVRTISDVLIDPQRVLDLAADLIRIPSVSPVCEADVAAAIGVLRREGIGYRLEDVAPG